MPTEGDLARVRRERAREDAHERRLAGAVLADEGVDRPTRDAKRHPVERTDGSEVLGDVRELDVGSGLVA